MKNLYLLIVFTLVLNGCAGSPASIMMAKPEQLRTMDTLDLINALDITGSENALLELERRKVFTHKELGLIKQQQVAVGMSKIALYASQGFPNSGETIMQSGVTGKVFFYPNQKIYLINDKIIRIETHH